MHLHTKELNMQQHRWLELVCKYDCEFHYHPDKANKVANALSRKAVSFATSVEKIPRALQIDMCNLGMEVIIGKLSALTIQPTILEAIKGCQLTNSLMEKFKQKALEEKQLNFFVLEDGVLGYKGGRIYMPNNEEINKHILYEAQIYSLCNASGHYKNV